MAAPFPVLFAGDPASVFATLLPIPRCVKARFPHALKINSSLHRTIAGSMQARQAKMRKNRQLQAVVFSRSKVLLAMPVFAGHCDKTVPSFRQPFYFLHPHHST
jgi:hypothetical protein